MRLRALGTSQHGRVQHGVCEEQGYGLAVPGQWLKEGERAWGWASLPCWAAAPLSEALG